MFHFLCLDTYIILDIIKVGLIRPISDENSHSLAANFANLANYFLNYLDSMNANFSSETGTEL